MALDGVEELRIQRGGILPKDLGSLFQINVLDLLKYEKIHYYLDKKINPDHSIFLH